MYNACTAYGISNTGIHIYCGNIMYIINVHTLKFYVVVKHVDTQKIMRNTLNIQP